MNVENLFSNLDAAFINFKEKVDPIVWKGSDVYIKQNFDVTIPVVSGCVVKYYFTTTGGDIELSTEFLLSGKEPEVLSFL